MGILRSDRITGLGGANAIKGSVFFGTFGSATYGNQIIVTPDSELDIGAGNFTVECWFYSGRVSGYQTLIGQQYYKNSGSGTNAFILYLNNDGIYVWNRLDGSFSNVFGVTGLWKASTWNHVAFVREGTGSNENKIYVNGSLAGSAFTNSANYTSGQLYYIGGNHYSQNDFGQYPISGYISNARISNVARYTANFTPPTSEFAVDSNTILLACQSSSNILKEETEKTLYYTNVDNNAPPQASHFTPNSPVGFSTTTDVGSQYGTTFDGFTVFATSTYLVPPSGNTRERNRGRGLIMGGGTPSGASTGIESIEVQSSGNGVDFGSLSATTRYNGGAASATRGLSIGGKSPSVNTIEFVTIADSSNSTDFGDLTQDRRYPSPVSNDTRAVIMGGYAEAPVGYNNIIDFVTIATAGNATDFGDTTNTVTNGAPVNSTTRGLMCGGQGNDPYARENVIQFITIASTGNAQDFGDLTLERRGMSSVSSSTRGIISGGAASPAATNIMDYVTIASAGDAIDFGDSTVAVAFKPIGQICSRTRGVFVAGGYPSQGNVIDFVTIATTGNASDFGDLLVSISDTAGACSDSHGGLS